jgi:hypothetical protein
MILARFSVTFIFAVILAAHFIAPKEYNWRENTISELASQKYKYRFIMQLGFIGFGVLLSVGIISDLLIQSLDVKNIPILVYSLSVMLSGVFSTKPFNNSLDFSKRESQLHSLFAQIAGLAFSIGVLAYFFYVDSIWLKIVHFGFFLFVIIVSFLFGRVNTNKGILQRVLYIGSFIWLALFFK